jgi:hypothetical protein
MAKRFYTEKDIEDMFKSGTMSLEVNDAVVLTELAYEKANSLGMKLLRDQPDNPPSAPIRPYISKKQVQRPVAAAAASGIALQSLSTGNSGQGTADGTDLQQRIRSAVVARLGAQVDANLLDVIIKRVLNSTGVK